MKTFDISTGLNHVNCSCGKSLNWNFSDKLVDNLKIIVVTPCTKCMLKGYRNGYSFGVRDKTLSQVEGGKDEVSRMQTREVKSTK